MLAPAQAVGQADALDPADFLTVVGADVTVAVADGHRCAGPLGAVDPDVPLGIEVLDLAAGHEATASAWPHHGHPAGQTSGPGGSGPSSVPYSALVSAIVANRRT